MPLPVRRALVLPVALRTCDTPTPYCCYTMPLPVRRALVLPVALRTCDTPTPLADGYDSAVFSRSRSGEVLV